MVKSEWLIDKKHRYPPLRQDSHKINYKYSHKQYE